MALSPMAKSQLLLGSALFVALGLLWVNTDGSIKHVNWQAPSAQSAQLQALLEVPPQSSRPLVQDANALMVIQERPLFVLGRRPVPVAPVVADAQKVDKNIWEKAAVLGIFEGDVSGMIFRLEGKDRRLLLNQSFEGWTLTSVLPRRIGLSRQGQELYLDLQKTDMSKLIPSAAAALPVRGRSAFAAPANSAPAVQTPSPNNAQPAPPLEMPVFGGTAKR